MQAPDRLANWLYGTARKVALRTSQQRPRRIAQPSGDSSPSVDPLAEVSGRELLRLIDAEIARLPEPNRLALVLCAIEGLSINDAARRIDCSAAAMKNRLGRARALLAKRLARRGITLPAAMAALLGDPLMALTKTLSAAVVALAEGGTPSASVASLAATGGLAAVKLQVALFAALIAGLAGIGAFFQPSKSAETPPPAKQPTSLEGEVESKTPLGKDRHGDPLPNGAVARFGTMRFRNVEGPVAFSPDGRVLAANRGKLTLFDAQTGTTLRTLDTRGYIRQISFSGDGKRLLVHNGNNETESIWEVETGKKLQQVDSGGGVLVRNGDAVMQLEWRGLETSISLLDDELKSIAKFRCKGNPQMWSASPRGDKVALAVNNRVWVVDVVKGEELIVCDDEKRRAWGVSRIEGFVFSPDGEMVDRGGQQGGRRLGRRGPQGTTSLENHSLR